ncbi:hypothetical protein C8R44DRAFT_774770 [Mycena epipterygia]|nr:hypothetical protein C8R44DRAFT_774770 [Mycena epipterygia]
MALITIDDSDGEVVYQPQGSWSTDAIPECPGCLGPSLQLAYNGTWQGAIFNSRNEQGDQQTRKATVSFFGSSVAVNCILSNSLTNPTGNSDMVFIVDGIQAGTYSHKATGAGDFLSNQTVFQSAPLALINHTLVIQNGLSGGGPSLMLLDSITYSAEDSTSASASQTSTTVKTSPSPTSKTISPAEGSKSLRTWKILASVLPVSIVLLLVFLWVWIRRRRSRRLRYSEASLGDALPTPFLNTYPTPSVVGSETHTITASSVRRHYLDRELRAAQEKIVDIADLERRQTSMPDVPQNFGAGSILRVLTTRGRSRMSTNSEHAPMPELDLARRRNDELMERIRELETQMNSAWALGLSDEPPPGYTI